MYPIAATLIAIDKYSDIFSVMILAISRLRADLARFMLKDDFDRAHHSFAAQVGANISLKPRRGAVRNQKAAKVLQRHQRLPTRLEQTQPQPESMKIAGSLTVDRRQVVHRDDRIVADPGMMV